MTHCVKRKRFINRLVFNKAHPNLARAVLEFEALRLRFIYNFSLFVATDRYSQLGRAFLVVTNQKRLQFVHGKIREPTTGGTVPERISRIFALREAGGYNSVVC